jgi:3-hydroxymyristoyl/3-hydroxydecanoyl-(acyl carrier protein) dehydratase
MRFYLFDRVVEAERGKRMTATKLVDLTDEYFNSHYTRQPVMPATMLMEAMAQTGGMLNNLNHDFTVEMVLILMGGVRLYRPVRAGELLTVTARMVYDHPYGATLSAEARVEAEVVAAAERIAFAHSVVTDPDLIRINRERFNYQSGTFVPAGK